MSKNLYVIAGPNGAGKTTFAREFLPHFAKCDEFVNADLIATGLSPFSPTGTAIQAGRLVLQRVRELADKGVDFGFETTLSGQAYQRFFQQLSREGYKVHLFFLWLPTEGLAVKRVADRVRQGGHSVPEKDIRRRYWRGLENLFKSYACLAQTCVIYDNSSRHPEKVAYWQNGQFHKLQQPQLQVILKQVNRHETSL
jgi:predicted ABC-type ATPase